MKTSSLALALIILAAAYRIVAVYVPDLSNLSPVMALAFCGAVFLERKILWLVPFAALLLSDLWIDWHYATEHNYAWSWPEALIRMACFAFALGIGGIVARRPSWLNLASGALGCSLLFYFVSNTISWWGDLYYPKTSSGWWLAMTIGHPEFPPTLWFFRNTLIGDLLFTGVFALAVKRLALPSLTLATARSHS